MEQFNLEKYLANPDLRIVTRDGRPVRIICTDSGMIGGQIVAIVTMANKNKDLLQFNENGSYYSYSDSESEYDLFFAPTKYEGWVNIIRSEVYNEAFCGKIYASKEEAESYANNATLATARIEWEE